MMANPNVQSLQIAVRRRLWRGQFIASTRLALWGSALFMLLAVAVHLTMRPVRVDAVLLAIVALWTAMMAWAALRRPSDSACALWADRHLGGESAFGTLLEMRDGTQGAPHTSALQWLEHWATARVPHSLQILSGRRESTQLSRPLLSLLVCASLATIVLMLPGTAPSAPQASGTPSTSGAAGRPTPDAEPASTERVSALASALRSADSRRASDRRDNSQAAVAGSGKSDASTAPRTAQPGVAPKGDRTSLDDPLPDSIDTAASAPVTSQGSGAGSGRDAGDSRDDRADAGVSRVPQSTIQVQRRESSERRPSLERQADVDQLAAFDDDLPTRRTATEREDTALAAATPPPAIDATPLTPTKAAYVQAWMKASRQRR
jgi:hypothetical protein